MRTPLAIASPFDCARTCPHHERLTRGLYLCRFNPLFSMIGAAEVHSHTVKVKCEITDPRALESAVRSLGWTWHGLKTHQLYSQNREHGHGFTPPNWRFPVVLTDSASLAFDNYNGAWGDAQDLETLKSAYLSAKIETSAAALGWQCERTPQGITVYHPSGGRLDITSAGLCDTTGFTGTACHEAREALGLATDGPAQNKNEIDHMPAVIQEGV